MARPCATATLDLETATDAPGASPLGVSSASFDLLQPFALTAAAPVFEVEAGAGHEKLDRAIAEATYHGLARATGLSRSHITGILKGRRNYTAHYIAKVSSALGVSVAELMEYVGCKRVQYLATLAQPRPRKRASKPRNKAAMAAVDTVADNA
jgi:plasmid maintenance system antidote protein VapI